MAGGGTLLLFGVGFWLLGLRTPAVVVGSYGVITLVTLVVLQFWPATFRPVVWMHVIVVSLVPFGVSLGMGGLLESAGYIIWGLIGPLAALMFLGRRATGAATGLFLACLVASAVVPIPADHPLVVPLPLWLSPALGVANIAGASILCLATLVWFVRHLRVEQDRADRLLLSVLPPAIARDLRGLSSERGGRGRGVSILVAEIVDLDPLCQRLSAAEVADLLESVFLHFDGLAARHRLERVRTLGDTFMVVAGLPDRRAAHAVELAELALEMRAAVASQRFAGHRVELRIGINSGRLSLGKAGRRRFIYEIWARALSLAARMEASAQPGCVVLTSDTRALLRDRYRCRDTGLKTSQISGAVAIHELLEPVKGEE